MIPGFVLAGEGAACPLLLQVSGSAPVALLGGAFRHKPHAGAASCSGAESPGQAAGAGAASPRSKPVVES